MVVKNNNNKDCNTIPLFQAGGTKKEWKNINQLEASIEEIVLQSGISMEEYLNVIKQKIDRTKFPITLNPETATFDDVAIHGILRQRLGPTTVTKNIRYAKFMEHHIVPVDFRNPSYENFINHMDHREQFEFEESEGYSALTHEWKAMQMFLRVYGIKLDDWPYKPPSFPLYKAKVIPLPEQVNKIIQLQYSKDSYENALIQ